MAGSGVLLEAVFLDARAHRVAGDAQPPGHLALVTLRLGPGQLEQLALEEPAQIRVEVGLSRLPGRPDGGSDVGEDVARARRLPRGQAQVLGQDLRPAAGADGPPDNLL